MFAHDVVELEVELMEMREMRDAYQTLARTALDEVASLTTQLNRALAIVEMLRRQQRDAK